MALLLQVRTVVTALECSNPACRETVTVITGTQECVTLVDTRVSTHRPPRKTSTRVRSTQGCTGRTELCSKDSLNTTVMSMYVLGLYSTVYALSKTVR